MVNTKNIALISTDSPENRANRRKIAKYGNKYHHLLNSANGTFELDSNGTYLVSDNKRKRISSSIKLIELASGEIKLVVNDGKGRIKSLTFKRYELEDDLDVVIKKLRKLGWKVFDSVATKKMLRACLRNLTEKKRDSSSKNHPETTENFVKRGSNPASKVQNNGLSNVERRGSAAHETSGINNPEMYEEYDGKHVNSSKFGRIPNVAAVERSSTKLLTQGKKTDDKNSDKITKNARGVPDLHKTKESDDAQDIATNKSVDTSKDKPNTPDTTAQLNTVNTNLDRQDGIPSSLTNKSSKVPVVLRVLWDKLAITFSTPKPDIELLILTARMLCKGHGDNYFLRPVQTLGRKLYHYRYQLIDPEGKQVCLIEFAPKNKKTHFIRIEFNPAEIGAFGIAQVNRVLKGLFGADYRTHTLDGNLTRIDATVDINHVSPNDVIVFSNRKRLSNVWHRSFEMDGTEVWETETLCLGSTTSDYSAQVYDKAIQLWKVKGHVIACKRTRVEASFEPRGKDKKSIKVRDFMAIKNPFAPIFIAYYPAPHDIDYEFNFFISHVRLNGAEHALGMIKDKHKRALYTNMILDCEVDWWQPDDLWAECIEYIKNTGLFPAEIFEEEDNLDK